MEATCQLCGSSDSQFAFIKNNYSHFQCSSCGSLYVHPTPTTSELLEFYRMDKGEHLSQSCWQDSHKHSWDLWKYTLKMAKDKAGLGNLLDIGCGTGEFLHFAQKLGWSNVEGIEVIPEIAEYATKLTGAKIYTSDFLETPLPLNSYSVITLWDVIEHLSNVPSVLNRIYSLLKPGGVVIIGTVNRDGVSIRLLKDKSLTIMPPEHLTFFTHKGMHQALRLQNFCDIMCWSSMIYLREWLRFLPQSKPSDNNIKEYATVRSHLTDSQLFLWLIRLANKLLRLTNLGDELVVVAQKNK